MSHGKKEGGQNYLFSCLPLKNFLQLGRVGEGHHLEGIEALCRGLETGLSVEIFLVLTYGVGLIHQKEGSSTALFGS